jgi:type IX secretion system substrate protein
MKNIKFLSIVFMLLAVSQFSFAQDGTENNGRDSKIAPSAPTVETPAPQQATATIEDDQDIPGASKEEPVDYYYPLDLDIMNDDLSNSIHPAEMVQKINDLTDLVNDLKRSYEELRLENKIVRESLSNCCSSSQLGLSAKDAYLLQNAPNPFTESAEIRYFIPAGMENVEIHICDVKGEVLNKSKVKEAGYGKLAVNANQLTTGTYIYLLSIDGEVIDSKVMIKTANN